MAIQPVNNKISAGKSRTEWILYCDGCNVSTTKTSAEPGDAADQARKEGFTTRIKNVLDPAHWFCRKCVCEKDQTTAENMQVQV